MPLLAVVVLLVSDWQARPAHAIIASPMWPVAAPRACTGRHGWSSFVSGTVTCASAYSLTIMPSGTAAAATLVLVAASTQVCRAAHGCTATWRDLRPGDYVDVGAASGQLTAGWVDANMVTGYGVIHARTTHSLTLAIAPHAGSAGSTRVLLLTSSTIVTAGLRTFRSYRGSIGSLRVGQSIYFTASADSSRLRTAHLYALRILQTH